MFLLTRLVPKLLRREPSPLAPRVFANQNFEYIPTDDKIDEETFSDYLAARYYPALIGEVFASPYQVVGKLGYGAFSTVWLARDLNQHSHVVLKILIQAQAMGSSANRELDTYKHISAIVAASQHPGRGAIRPLLDNFNVTGPDGEHQCLVHPPLWESIKTFIGLTEAGRCPHSVMSMMLFQLFAALDFMHRECRLIHTDIKADNIMFSVQDNSIFEAFENEELEHPSPRKEVDGGRRIIYASRQLAIPENLGPPVLCDFGAAVSADGVEAKNSKDVQPDLYRAPEVILKIPWSYEIDIWNVGCMIWDVFENRHLFSGRDLEHKAYRGRAHLASIIALLGPPPPDLVARSSSTARDKFFSRETGLFDAGISLPPSTSFEEIETTLVREGEKRQDREQFLRLMRKMLQWTPERRSTAKELLDDPWILAQLPTERVS